MSQNSLELNEEEFRELSTTLLTVERMFNRKISDSLWNKLIELEKKFKEDKK